MGGPKPVSALIEQGRFGELRQEHGDLPWLVRDGEPTLSIAATGERPVALDQEFIERIASSKLRRIINRSGIGKRTGPAVNGAADAPGIRMVLIVQPPAVEGQSSHSARK